MKLNPSEIDIPAETPFVNDKLGRQELVEYLTQFVSTIQEPFVLAVDSPWGQGKTIFIKMWQRHLESIGTPCIYFNAWENDFTEDPFIALVSEVKGLLTQGNTREKTELQDRFEQVKTAGIAILKRGGPAAVKALTAGVLDLNAVTEDVLASLAESAAKEAFEHYDEDRESLEKFKEELADFAEKIREEVEDDPAAPVIFFIDELDRCRPTYAIELLERVKHLFSVPGIVFVLSLDNEQLGHSLRCVYGRGMDTDGYLHRFINMHYQLPDPEKGMYCAALFQRFALEEFFNGRQGEHTRYDQGRLKIMLSELFWVFEFSLRQQERCFTNLSVCCRLTPPNQLMFPDMLACLIVLKMIDEEIYQSYLTGVIGRDELLELVRREKRGETYLQSREGWIFEACIVAGIQSNEIQQKLLTEYLEVSNDETLSTEEQERSQSIREWVPTFGARMSNTIPLKILDKRITIAHNFI